jgi:hypothetical protein
MAQDFWQQALIMQSLGALKSSTPVLTGRHDSTEVLATTVSTSERGVRCSGKDVNVLFLERSVHQQVHRRDGLVSRDKSLAEVAQKVVPGYKTISTVDLLMNAP